MANNPTTITLTSEAANAIPAEALREFLEPTGAAHGSGRAGRFGWTFRRRAGAATRQRIAYLLEEEK